MEAPRNTLVDTAVLAVAAIFSVLYAVYFLTVRDVTDVTQLQAFFEMTLFGAALVTLYGSTWLALGTDAEEHLRQRLLWWGGAGAVFLVFVSGSLMVVVSPAPDFEDQLLQLLFSAGFGVSAGLVMGVLEIQGIKQARERTRADLTARKREEERQRLELLNQYLRHEILNKVQIIEMNADIALRRTDESVAEYGRLETIAQRTGDIGRFVQSIRSILQASDHQPSLESVQLSGVLSAEIEKLERSFPDVTVTHSASEDVHVEADDLLPTAISNLLENAVEHGAERVDVGVAVDDDRVTLRVSDDGPGIPQEAQPTLFDPPESGDHGYGLFLTKNLVELYGGRLELAETGPDGTTFVLALSRMSPDEETWATTSVKAT
jgi:signal transduction histidine kinase